MNADDQPGPLIRKLRSFIRLPAGWSHGEGRPVAAEAIRVAEGFAELSTQLQIRADVFPGLRGDCAIAFYDGDKCVEIIIDPADLQHVTFHVESGQGFEFTRLETKQDAEIGDAVNRIVKLISDKWKSQESSHSSTLMGSGAGFRILSSSTPLGTTQTLLTVG